MPRLSRLRVGRLAIFGFVCAVSSSAVLLQTRASTYQSGNGTSRNFLYIFDGAGRFAKIKLSTASLDGFWSFPWINSPSGKIPKCRASSADPACTFFYGQLQASSDTQSLYAVIPTADSLGRNGGNLNYQVAKIELPEMTISEVAPIPGAQAEWPHLLLDPEKGRVLVSYRDPAGEKKVGEPSIISVVDIYDARDLKKHSTIRNTTSVKDFRQLKSNPGTIFGYRSYFSNDGTTIFDGLYVTSVSDDSMTKSYVNPLEKLSPEQRDRLKPFQKTDAATQRSYFDFVAGDSAAGRTVVRINDYSHGQAVYWTTELRSGQASPPITAKFGIDRLSPDGRLLLIQAASFKKTDTGAPALTAQPEFWIFDVATGKQSGQFQSRSLPETPSDAELSCFSTSGEQLVVAAEGRISVMNIADGRIVAEFRTESLGRPVGNCIFADE